MATFKPGSDLPTEFDLPDSDDQPLDNELQLLVPLLLRDVLSLAWAGRTDWFFGVNLGLYYDPTLSAIAPNAFLAMGVPRYRPQQGLRLSYLLWQEQVVPQWVLEIVSQNPGGEYDVKFKIYEAMGVLYYAIYNPDYWKRDQHEVFELYRLEDGRYIKQMVEPVWMPELGLGVGRAVRLHEGIEREWLYWYDEQGNRYLAPTDVIAQERVLRKEMKGRWLEEQARQQAEQRLQQLLEELRRRGIDPDSLQD